MKHERTAWAVRFKQEGREPFLCGCSWFDKLDKERATTQNIPALFDTRREARAARRPSAWHAERTRPVRVRVTVETIE